MKEPTKEDKLAYLECSSIVEHLIDLENRVARLERIVKAGFNSEHPEILDEVNDL